MEDVRKAVREISALLPEARAACEGWLKRCEGKGLKVLITETYRSQDRQEYLYSLGRSRPGKIVTKTLESKHTGRRAWDFCQNIQGREYEHAFMRQCAEIAKSMGLDSGYFWKWQDSPHIQLNAGARIKIEEEEEKVDKQMKKMEIDGKLVEVETIFADGRNYVKLQDLAKSSTIQVEWDESRKMPVIRTV